MEIEDVVRQISKDLSDMKESQIRMEMDIAEHIRRTNLLEDRLDKDFTPIHKAYIGVKWSVGAILTLSALMVALSKLGFRL